MNPLRHIRHLCLTHKNIQSSIHGGRQCQVIQPADWNKLISRRRGGGSFCACFIYAHLPDLMCEDMTGGAGLPEGSERKVQLVFCLTVKIIAGEFPLHHRETPEALEEVLCPLAQQDTVTRTDQQDGIEKHFLGLCLGKNRQISRVPGPESITESGERAVAAVRRSRNTNGGTQIHDSLVVISRAVRRNKACCKGNNPAVCFGNKRIRTDAEETGDDTDHIAVHSRDGDIISDGSNSACGIRTDAADFSQFIGIAGQDTAVFRHNLPGSFQEIPGTGIVSKAFPGLQHILFRCGRQRGKGRKTLQKPVII